MQLYPYTDSKNTCSLQTGRARPVPNTAPHVALLAERFLLRLLLARLCAAAQEGVLPVHSLLPKPARSSLRPGEAPGVCGEEDAAEPQRRPLCCRRTAAGWGRSARSARPGSTAEGPAQQGKPRDCESPKRRSVPPSSPHLRLSQVEQPLWQQSSRILSAVGMPRHTGHSSSAVRHTTETSQQSVPHGGHKTMTSPLCAPVFPSCPCLVCHKWFPAFVQLHLGKACEVQVRCPKAEHRPITQQPQPQNKLGVPSKGSSP